MIFSGKNVGLELQFEMLVNMDIKNFGEKKMEIFS